MDPRIPPRRFAAVLALAMGWLPMIPSCSGDEESLVKLRVDASRDGEYRFPGAEELRGAETLFRRTLARGESLAALQAAWGALAFELRPVRDRGTDFWVLRERENAKKGRGFYVFRTGRTPAIAVEAPHCSFDKLTGEIAMSLMLDGPFIAGAWSTAPRQQADLAHLSESYFQSFTAAYAQAYPQGLLIQLHGFEQGKRKSQAAAEADVILSGCAASAPSWLKRMSDALKRDLREVVKLYPDDVKDLGGTANAQAQILRDLGHDGFAHIEIGQETRQRMTEDPTLRGTWIKAVDAAYRDNHRSAEPGKKPPESGKKPGE